jgi:hypothetical protein
MGLNEYDTSDILQSAEHKVERFPTYLLMMVDGWTFEQSRIILSIIILIVF